MDRAYMNSPFSRPYQSTCGMQYGMHTNPKADLKDSKYRKNSDFCDAADSGHYEILKTLPLAMAYIPMQEFHKTFDHQTALYEGTIFPELCKPFCGKRGMKKC